MMRIVLAAVLSFLLLGLQQEGAVHGYQHDAARLAAGGKATLQSSADGLCPTCVLIAGGTHAVASADASFHLAAHAFAALHRSYLSHDTLAPIYYASRAPPLASF
ncbi:MAG TPA: hypothetical protein VFC24_18650 [Casimicrobiaceae bacterium]|nr:hypothetical protein [Casimicrobiaceae bacterium]